MSLLLLLFVLVMMMLMTMMMMLAKVATAFLAQALLFAQTATKRVVLDAS